MKIELQELKPKLKIVLRWIEGHIIIVSIVAVVLLYSGLVLRINLLNRREPTDTAVTEKLQTIKRLKIDQRVVDQIKQLEDNSSEVRALFKQARDNPFQE